MSSYFHSSLNFDRNTQLFTLIYSADKIRSEADKDYHAGGIFMHLQKAFDTVRKLEYWSFLGHSRSSSSIGKIRVL